MNGEVVILRSDLEVITIGDMGGVFQEHGRRPDDQRFCKRPVNHAQAIKKFLLCNLVQEAVACSRAVAGKSSEVSQKGRRLHKLSHIAQHARFQTLVHMVFPPECLSCRAPVISDAGLCGPCWREVAFIEGAVCETCGIPMAGDVAVGDRCDECLRIARPWSQGRARLLYQGKGRALVLALKHGDRTDIAPVAGAWLAQSAAQIVKRDMLVAPVPLHWRRMIKRKYNQSALLADVLARELGLTHCRDLLKRGRATQVLDGKTVEQRFAQMRGAISVAPAHAGRLAGRSVLIVDDVMTSGATLAACSEACLAAGAREVCVVALARVAKDA